MPDAKVGRMRSRHPKRTVAEAAAEHHLPLVIRQRVVPDGHEHFAADVETSRPHRSARREDDVVLGDREAATARGPALDLELEEMIGAAIVEPVDDAPWLDPPCRRVVGEHLDRHPLVDDLADLLAPPIGQDHAGRIVQAPEHDTDLLADLVDEDHAAAGARDGGGELAQRLRHEARLQTRQRIAHVAVELGARHEGRHRVDHDDVDGVGAHQGLGDLERLLAGVGLGDQQLVGVDAEVLRVDGIERVLGVDERGRAAEPLRLGDDVERERRLPRGLRAEDLGDAAARDPADAERDVERERAGRE